MCPEIGLAQRLPGQVAGDELAAGLADVAPGDHPGAAGVLGVVVAGEERPAAQAPRRAALTRSPTTSCGHVRACPIRPGALDHPEATIPGHLQGFSGSGAKMRRSERRDRRDAGCGDGPQGLHLSVLARHLHRTRPDLGRRQLRSGPDVAEFAGPPVQHLIERGISE